MTGSRGRPSHRRAAAAASIALLAAATATGCGGGPSASSHQAATPLATDSPCYLQDRYVHISASGLPHGAAYTVALDGQNIGGGNVDAHGRLSGRLPSGRVTGRAERARHTLRVTLENSPRAFTGSFYVTRFDASFTPKAATAPSALVRFSIDGFGVGPAAPGDPAHDPRPRRVYLHYVAPTGALIHSLDLGRTHGLCGSIPRTRAHRLFFFSPGSGTWQLQFDTSAKWSRSSRPRVVRRVVVR